jgi:hypothetical protein
MKRITRAQSIAKRQLILDACKNKSLILSEIAEATGIIKTQLNHHLIFLVAEGYLIKNLIPVKVNKQDAYTYQTINFEPYVYGKRMEVEEKPIICPVQFDSKLMFWMGYTNISPIKGNVYIS